MNILLIYEQNPDSMQLYFFGPDDLTEDDRKDMLEAHNTLGGLEGSDDDLHSWLSDFLVAHHDKEVFDSNRKDTQLPLLMRAHPVTVVVTGFIN